MAGYSSISGTPTGAPIQAPAPGIRGFMSRLSEAGQSVLAQQRPWSEVLNWSAFGKPDSFAEASRRIRINLTYFRVNYFIVLLGLVLLGFLWHPVSLFVVALLLVAWALLFVYRTEPLVLFNRTFSDKEISVFMSLATLVVIFLFTNIGSFLISIVLSAILAICIHGAFRVPDDLYLDEEQSSRGFLYFVASNAPQSTVISGSRV